MAVSLGVDPAVNAARSESSAVAFIGDVLNALDRALRSTRNKFASVALLNTGAATGQVPVIGANAKLPAGVVPDTLPFSRVATGKFKAGQIPDHYADRIGVGTLPAGRFGGLPATKLTGGASGQDRADPRRLPAGYSLLSRPTGFAVGGQGVQDADGATVGTLAGFVETRRVVDALPSQVPAGHVRAEFGDYRPDVRGLVDATNTLYLQVVMDCVLPRTAGWGDDDAGGGVCPNGICSAEPGGPLSPGGDDGDDDGGSEGPTIPPGGGDDGNGDDGEDGP